jgi:hypothetical protein
MEFADVQTKAGQLMRILAWLAQALEAVLGNRFHLRHWFFCPTLKWNP